MKKQIFLAIVVYSFLSLLQPLSNFILLPIYTKFFSESDYGTLSVLNNLNVFLTILGGLNLVNAIIAFYSTFSDSEEGLNKYIGNILSFTFYFNLAFLAVMCLFGNLFFKLIFKQEISFFPNGLLVIVYGMFNNIISGYLNFAKYQRKLGRFAFITLCLFIISTVLQYVFIVYFKKGITGTLVARVIGVGVGFVIILFYNYRYFFARIQYTKYIKASLIYSISTILSACINWGANYNDRFFIERFIDLKSLGIYSLLSTISSLTELGYFALGSALQPFIFDYYKAKDARGSQKLYQIFILLSVCIVSFIILFGSNLNLFIHNKGYLQAVNYLSVMTIGYIFSSLFYLFNLQIIFAKKSNYFIYLSLYVLVSSLLLNTILIPKFGIWGAVASSTLGRVLSAFIVFYFANKSLKLSFEKSNYLMILFFVLLIMGFWLLSYNHIISYNLSGVLQFLAVLATVFILSRKMLFQFFTLAMEKIRKPAAVDQ